ncbi:hypothetical protein MBLNU457_1804t1 [Dothideomycetes sp. NU457]
MSTIFGFSPSSESQRPKRGFTYGKAGRTKPAKKPNSTMLAQTAPVSKSINRSAETDNATTLAPDDVFDIPDSDEEQRNIQVPATKKLSRKPPATEKYVVPALAQERASTTKLDPKAYLGPKATIHHDPKLKGVPRASDLANYLEKKARRTEQHNVEPPKDDRRNRSRVESKPSLPQAVVKPRNLQPSPERRSDPVEPQTFNKTRLRQQSLKKKTDNLKVPAPAAAVPARRQKRPQEQADAGRSAKRQTPDRNIVEPVTPANVKSAGRAPLTRSISQTPKQQDLWSKLLPSDPVDDNEETPRASVVHQDVSAVAEHKISTPPGRRPQTQRQGSRLVDRLKLGQTPTNDDSSDSDEDTMSFEARLSALDNASKSAVQPQPRKGPSRQASALTNSQYNSQQESGPPAVRRTYGESRSYLQDASFEEGLLVSLESDTPKPPARSKTAFDAQESEDDTSQGIRTIHELRAAGSKKRFRDDVSALLDDIKLHARSGWSRRRTALMDLSNRFQDKVFAAQFVECGFDRALVRECRDVARDRIGIEHIGDSILCVVLIRYLAADLPRHCTTDLHESSILTHLAYAAADTTKIATFAKNKHYNMSKMLQSTLLDYMEEIREDKIWPEAPKSITRSLLALKAGVILATKLRSLGQSSPLIDDEAVKGLVNITTSSHDPHLPTSSTDENRPLTLEMTLSLLEIESLSVGSTDSLEGSSFDIAALDNLAQQLSTLLHPDMIHVSMTTLRLCLNLTNNKPASCDLFASDSAIHAILERIEAGFHLVVDTQQTDKLDPLLLVLGLAINLAEYSNGVREHTVSCSAQLLPNLVTIFVQGQILAAEAETREQLEAQSGSNVGYGYLAVFLGNLCMEPSAKTLIRSHLPEQDLGILVRAIKEFVQYHQTVDNSELEGEGGKEVWRTFTSRLLAVAEKIEE